MGAKPNLKINKSKIDEFLSGLDIVMTPEERHELVVEIATALACTLQPAAASTPQLTEDELRWIKLAIEAEGRKIKFRDAVIQHSLTGLIWLGILGVGYVFKEFAMNHFWKP